MGHREVPIADASVAVAAWGTRLVVQLAVAGDMPDTAVLAVGRLSCTVAVGLGCVACLVVACSVAWEAGRRAAPLVSQRQTLRQRHSHRRARVRSSRPCRVLARRNHE